MRRGDVYRIDFSSKELPEIADIRTRPGWKEFHKTCGSIDVFFDRYRRVRKNCTVEVFTATNRRGRVVDLMYLCTGEGHDPISASIDGLRKSGGSSLSSWLAALTMQIEQLNGNCFHE